MNSHALTTKNEMKCVALLGVLPRVHYTFFDNFISSLFSNILPEISTIFTRPYNYYFDRRCFDT